MGANAASAVSTTSGGGRHSDQGHPANPPSTGQSAGPAQRMGGQTSSGQNATQAPKMGGQMGSGQTSGQTNTSQRIGGQAPAGQSQIAEKRHEQKGKCSHVHEYLYPVCAGNARD
jgi:hypothetical protein